ncbi:LlsX family protein [Enterococcus sp. 5B3_DIV0040]|uniref:LlsX family protein n=1 Tax=Enterococcus sp. 5B3_DIV0040 TaxID=1834182 RepID=UPI000A35BB83|nr:LlsX family protein [Enterococcus sp. 5B3_DIV0040]OTO01317.1 hypothetical protein A5883_003634 [Enterococcus sp. 5B3_DIV0040]
MKKKVKIVMAVVVGLLFALMLMGVVIYFSYTNAYRTNLDTLIVKCFGLPIYELTKSGIEYVGKPIGIYMGAVCGICMLFSLMVEELVNGIKNKG